MNQDELNNQLILSVKKGCLKSVERLIEQGADIHAQSDSALWMAARDGHLDVVTLLLDRGCDIHAWDNFALSWAAKENHVAIVELLLNRGANIGAGLNASIRGAVEQGSLEAVSLLVQRGADGRFVQSCDFKYLIKSDRATELLTLLSILPHIQPELLFEDVVEQNALACANALIGLGAKPAILDEMSDEMRDLFSAHEQKRELIKKQYPDQYSDCMEPSL